MIKFSNEDVMKTVLSIIAEDAQIDEASSHDMTMKFKDRVKKAIDLKKKEDPKKDVKEEVETVDEVPTNKKLTDKIAGKIKVPATEALSYEVNHAEFGVGKTIPGQIYEDMTVDVMFEEQIVLGVPMDELEVIE